MRTIALADFGAPPELHDLPTPEPGEGEVLVRVTNCSLNGFDSKVADGFFQGMLEHRFPVVLGKDFAGTVAATGDGVDSFQEGDPVFGVVMGWVLGPVGGFGEYAVVSGQNVARIPEGLDHATAGALGLAGATAVDSLNAVGLAANETVLISGATGGVGVLAVQLAAQRGARVIATAKPGARDETVRSLGAHETVDYTGDLAESVRALRPNGVDVVIHLAGDGVDLAKLLVPGGRIASAVGLSQDHVGDLDVQVFPIAASPVTSTLDSLAAAVAAGSLTLPVQQTYPLEEVPRAFADFAAGKLGKLAVTVQ